MSSAPSWQPAAGADLIVFNGRVATQDERRSLARAVAMREDGIKGAIVPGQLADLAVPEEQIKRIEAVLTIVGGKLVYGAGSFAPLAPPPPPVLPAWSPVTTYGGYHRTASRAVPPWLHGGPYRCPQDGSTPRGQQAARRRERARLVGPWV
jgi:hypothetical protein